MKHYNEIKFLEEQLRPALCKYCSSNNSLSHNGYEIENVIRPDFVVCLESGLVDN
jgi:hypothetical protein